MVSGEWRVLTIQDMDEDCFRIGVGWITGVLARVRAGGPLNEQVTRRHLPLLRDHAHAAPRRVVVYLLQQNITPITTYM